MRVGVLKIVRYHKLLQDIYMHSHLCFKSRILVPDYGPPDENGILKTDKQEIMDRWKQYFADLMKSDNNIDNQVQEVHTIENDTEIDLPTYKEVSDIISKLRRNKAPGTDNIPAELVKHGGYMLKYRMYNLILLIWSKEQLPMEWLQGIICPIYKKGERTICSNYRPITILNIAYKIFTIILNNRLSKIVESKARIASGNKVYFANKKMFQSRHIKKGKVEIILFGN